MAEYYSEWRTHVYSCPECYWTGTGEDCKTGELFRELWEIECPKCSHRLDVIVYPTIEDIKANWDRASEDDKMQVLARESFLTHATSTELKDPEQLPEIEGDQIVLVWDEDFSDPDRNKTLIRHGDLEVWREASFYEGIHRFKEVLALLRMKYGRRLKDVVTTRRSHLDLWGDILWAPITEQSNRWAVWLTEPENWRTRKDTVYECTACRWNGGPAEVEVIVSEDKTDIHCPDCGTRLGNLFCRDYTKTDEFVSLVETCQTKMNEITATQSDRAEGRTKLRQANQLVEIEGSDLIFVWDCEDGEFGRDTVIRYGNTVIWREPCHYDCFARFRSIAGMLENKYGDRLVELAPTVRTCINIGDLLHRDPELEAKYQLPSRDMWRKKF